MPLVSKQLRALKGMRVSDGEICGKKKFFWKPFVSASTTPVLTVKKELSQKS